MQIQWYIQRVASWRGSDGTLDARDKGDSVPGVDGDDRVDERMVHHARPGSQARASDVRSGGECIKGKDRQGRQQEGLVLLSRKSLFSWRKPRARIAHPLYFA